MELWYKICIWIASGIYTVASWAFDLFLVLARGTVLDSDTYSGLIQNAYVLIGVVMLFIIAFTLLKTMINPDDQKKSATNIKKIIVNLITSGIILALLPTIFSFAFDFQNSVLSYNVIGGFFGFGTPGEDNISSELDVNDVKYQSRVIVDGVFTAFFNVNTEKCTSNPPSTDTDSDATQTNIIQVCQTQLFSKDLVGGIEKMSFAQASNLVKQTGEWNYYSAFAENAVDDDIQFRWFLCLIAGLLLIYVAVSFCFDMAVRLIKLVFYQIIAPIPIFARIIPEGKFSDIFGKWLKITLTCYLEVYMRILVFYFVIYITTQFRNSSFFISLGELNPILWLFANAFVILGLVMFMRQAPKLFSEITGIDSGKMKLGIKDKLKDSGVFAAANTIGGFAAGIAGSDKDGKKLDILRNAFSGAKQGFRHGLKNADMKGVGYSYARAYDYSEARRNGASRGRIWADSARKELGLDTYAEMEEKRIKNRAETVDNNSGIQINYKDSKGNQKQIVKDAKGVVANVEMVEDLKSQKAANVAQMSSDNEQLRVLDKQIAAGSARISARGAVKDEAEKKVREGDYVGSIEYTDRVMKQRQKLDANGKAMYDSNGQAIMEDYEEVQKRTFGGTYSEIENFIKNDLPIEERQKHNIKAIFDRMVDEYIVQEESSATSHISALGEQGLNALVDDKVAGGDGKKYSFLYDETVQVLNPTTGKMETRATGKTLKGAVFTVKNSDGTYTVKREDLDDKGNVQNTYDVATSSSHKYLLDIIDKIAKRSNDLITGKKQEVETGNMAELKEQNEAIDNFLKGIDEAKDAALKDPKMRGANASKTYTAKRNDKK